MASVRTAVVCLISLLSAGTAFLCRGMDFRSDRLEKMAEHIDVAWPGRDTVLTVGRGGRDIVIRITDGCVEHIGFNLFGRQRPQGIDQRVADFVERYWLSLTLPMKRLRTVRQEMAEERFVFKTGGLESVGAIQRNPSLPFSCEATENLVTITWGDDRRPVCRITFPVNHELILGRGMLENDRRLPGEINAAKIEGNAYANVELTPLSPDSLWTAGAGSYLDCSLKSERYYKADAEGSAPRPVFDAARSMESVTNLFTGCDIEQADNIRLSIRHIVFGLKEQQIETTVRKFVAYAMQNGCQPYVGIVSDGTGNSSEADILVIMHNSRLGYNHVLRASVPLSCIESGNGTVRARLNAFVPSSNIKNLFKN